MTIGEVQTGSHMGSHPTKQSSSEGIREVREGDIRAIKEWYRWRGEHFNGFRLLPPIGLIVPNVAAGWLVQTDAGLAMLEGYITNPEASSEKRNAALDAITQGLISRAHKLGYTSVVALFTDDGIGSRAGRHGFRDIGSYRMMSREV